MTVTAAEDESTPFDGFFTYQYREYALGHRKHQKPMPEVVTRTWDYEEDYGKLPAQSSFHKLTERPVRACYQADYPIVNPEATTDWARRGKPYRWDEHGNPKWKGQTPEGIDVEMMHASLVRQTTCDTCAAKRKASSGQQVDARPSLGDWHHAGDACAAQRAMSGGGRRPFSGGNPYQQAPANNDRAGGFGTNKPGPSSQNDDPNKAGDACAWARSHIS